ncbi:hypothetical protein [Sphingomonas hankookensis]|uniref:hypothetical protein n=1 Tax=Sphingomonas hankookensis TaxID=563996 RepID=UPI003F7A3C8C
MVTSGSLPMSCALIASTTLAALRLISTERACDARMPVTTISTPVPSTCSGAATPSAGVAGAAAALPVAVCASAGAASPAMETAPSSIERTIDGEP